MRKNEQALIVNNLRSQIKTIGFHCTRAKLLKRGYSALVLLAQYLEIEVSEKKLILAHNIVVAISNSKKPIKETPVRADINSIGSAIANKGFHNVRAKLNQKYTKQQLIAIAEQLDVLALPCDKKIAIAHSICEAIQLKTDQEGARNV